MEGQLSFSSSDGGFTVVNVKVKGEVVKQPMEAHLSFSGGGLAVVKV